MNSELTTAPTKIERLRHAIGRILIDKNTFPASAVITAREGDVWRAVAMAANASKGFACTIQDKLGDATGEDGIEMDLTIAVTIFGPTKTRPGSNSTLEVLWEKMVRQLHNAKPVYDGNSAEWNDRLRFQRWDEAGDIIPEKTLESVQEARQTIFKVRFTLEPDDE